MFTSYVDYTEYWPFDTFTNARIAAGYFLFVSNEHYIFFPNVNTL